MNVKIHDFETLCDFNKLQDRALAEIITEGKTKVDLYRWLSSIKASKSVTQEINSTIERNKGELQIATEDPSSDYREGYSYLTKPKLEKYFKFMCDAHDGVQKYINKAYPKKIRKKKPVDPARLIKNLKYLAKDESLNLLSIEPKDIIGAEMLTVYNTKTRGLTLYVAKTEQGISVKGSSLTNWDEEKSLSKKLRNSKNCLDASAFVSVGYAKVQPLFSSIKTKPSKPNGRINGNMILLWAKKNLQ